MPPEPPIVNGDAPIVELFTAIGGAELAPDIGTSKSEPNGSCEGAGIAGAGAWNAVGLEPKKSPDEVELERAIGVDPVVGAAIGEPWIWNPANMSLPAVAGAGAAKASKEVKLAFAAG
jgi:hypothetical protein